jgi:HJR/Mrr/RecB family endonuclease
MPPAYESAEAQARSEIEDHIQSLGWYDFQKLVAELLTAMGYHRSVRCSTGDDGVDVIAYKDPFGTVAGKSGHHRSTSIDYAGAEGYD